MIVLEALNAAPLDVFVGHLGAVFEHSPWVAERAYARRPFATVVALHASMVGIVDEAGEERQLALLRAHPELAGRAAIAGAMTTQSMAEQGGSGLLRCSPDEFARLQALNTAYGEKFGFPFIVAVRGLDLAAILSAFQRRLGHDPATERTEALRQVGRIAELRLADLVSAGSNVASGSRS